MPENTHTHARSMGTVHTEKMLAIPGMLEFRLGMVHANGGQALEYTRRPLEAIVGHQALKFDWMAGEVVEEDLLLKSGRVGIISIDAPVFFAGSIWIALLGGVTVGEITKAIYAALNDPEIETVVLDMDCPGGQVAGIGELVEAIDALAASKTVITYVHEMAASLAYWMASRTHRIVSNTSGEVGSIGAIAIAYDTSGWFREEGIRVIPITEAEQKTFGHMGIEITDAMVEREMDAIREIGSQFRASVTAKTGIEDEALLGLQGSMHYAGSAISLGLVDEVVPPSAFYASVHAGGFDHASNTDTTPTSGDAAAQNEDSTMSTIDISAMSESEKAALRQALNEDDKKDETTEEEEEDNTSTTDDEKKESTGDDEKKDDAEEDKKEEDEPTASALSMKEARAVLADFDMPKAAVNELACECLENGWNETTLLRKALKKSRETASTAVIEQEAAGDPNPIGCGRGSASSTGGGNAKAKYEAAIKAEQDANPGMTYQQAARNVAVNQPELRESLIAEANPNLR